jgi:hypothetical protein
MGTEILPGLAFDDTGRRPSCPPCMTARRGGQKQTLASSPSSPLTAKHQHLVASTGQVHAVSGVVTPPSASAKHKSRSLSNLLSAGSLSPRRCNAASAAISSHSQFTLQPEIGGVVPSSYDSHESTASLLGKAHGNHACPPHFAKLDGGHSSHRVSGATKWCPFFDFSDVLTCLNRQTITSKTSQLKPTSLPGNQQQQHASKPSLTRGIPHDDTTGLRNYNSCLELTKLENGCFNGRLSIADFPPGDIEVRLRENTVEFFVALRWWSGLQQQSG